MSLTPEIFNITNSIYSTIYKEYYRKIGLVPMLGMYSGGGGGNYSFDVYYDTSMFTYANITSSGSGSSGIGYDQITDGQDPLYTKYIENGYARLDQTTHKYTDFTNSVIVKTTGDYYGVPLVYISQTDGWKPVEMMPYLWRNMEPFYFENIGSDTIEITIETRRLSEYVLKSMYSGNFIPPSSGVRWCLYDATDGEFIDCDGNSGIVYYYPYNYIWNGNSASATYVRDRGSVLRHITIRAKHKIYIIRCDNDLESSLINQIREYGSSDYSSLFESLQFKTERNGKLKIGGNIASIFFPYTTTIGEYSTLPEYGDLNFPNDLKKSIMGDGGPLHWNFGFVKEYSATNSWIGVTFSGGDILGINDPTRHSDRSGVTDGTPAQIRLNYRNYSNLFSRLASVLVDASEIEFPVLYDTNSLDIYTNSQTNYCVTLNNMFSGCDGLTEAPREIPYIQCNTSGASYYQMFAGCTALTVSPLIYMCKDYGDSFRDMFASCPLKKLIFRTSTVQGNSGNEIGNLFGTSGLSSANSDLTIYKLEKVTYNGSSSNFSGFCGHSGTIRVRDIFTDRETFSDTYQHYKY